MEKQYTITIPEHILNGIIQNLTKPEYKRFLEEKYTQAYKKLHKSAKRKQNKEEYKKLERVKNFEFLKKEAEERRRYLVEHATRSEIIFKTRLRNLEIRYESQKIFFIGGLYYRIADFYLPDFSMIIEVDGGYHKDELQIKKDKLRESDLKQLDSIKFIRRLTDVQAMQLKDEEIMNELKLTEKRIALKELI